MKKPIQDALLSLYSYARHRGMFQTRLGRWLFLKAYYAYKTLWEPDIAFLRRFVAPDSWVVDVGANVGFFSRRFCNWVSGNGRVLAFEPEAENFRVLQRITKQLRSDALLCRQSLVADIDGMLYLELNPDNPADHHIGSQGVPTPAMRLDTAIDQLGSPRVGLLKIDVQGAELRVIDGARETLARSRPAIYMEIDDGALRRSGSSAVELENRLAALGYAMYEASANRLRNPIDSREARKIRDRLGYADFLFLPLH